MQADEETVYRWVEWLKSGTGEQQYQAALALRALAGDASNKHLIREAGGIEGLLRLLESGPDSILTVVGAETLSCLAADDPANRVLSFVLCMIQHCSSIFCHHTAYHLCAPQNDQCLHVLLCRI